MPFNPPSLDRLPGRDGRPPIERNLLLRVGTSIVLLPLVLWAVARGGLVFGALLLVLAAAMGWEWGCLVAPERRRWPALALAGAAACVVAAGFLWSLPVGLYAVLVVAINLYVVFRLFGWPAAGWAMLGCVVIPLSCLAAIYLRAHPGQGMETTAWVILAVVATDIGGYAAGRAIGGPKLAPLVSPSKTWAGLLGGLVLAALAGLLFGLWLPAANPPLLAMAAAGLALVSQAGDLLESAFKRRFNAKDSGFLIPGHGGVLDRVDGHAAALSIVALLILISGKSILQW